MSGIHVVYLVLALIFVIFLTYMFVYNIRQNHRQKAMRSRPHPPIAHH
jgi:preprotein translocase subunit YajC